jgi:CBS domain-containing protein
MTTAREIMTPDVRWLDKDATVAEAAKRFADEDFGALPVCDGEGRLCGVVTDRDLVVRALAEGLDPATMTVAQVIDEVEVITIGADDPVEEAIRTMKDNAVRRLPVIDGHDLVGMVSQADIARTMPDARVGDLVGAISEAPSNG